MLETKAEDCNKNKVFAELEAHQIDWHTTEGLLEGLSAHCNEDNYLTILFSERINLLSKKYPLISNEMLVILLVVKTPY